MGSSRTVLGHPHILASFSQQASWLGRHFPQVSLRMLLGAHLHPSLSLCCVIAMLVVVVLTHKPARKRKMPIIGAVIGGQAFLFVWVQKKIWLNLAYFLWFLCIYSCKKVLQCWSVHCAHTRIHLALLSKPNHPKKPIHVHWSFLEEEFGGRPSHGQAFMASRGSPADSCRVVGPRQSVQLQKANACAVRGRHCTASRGVHHPRSHASRLPVDISRPPSPSLPKSHAPAPKPSTSSATHPHPLPPPPSPSPSLGSASTSCSTAPLRGTGAESERLEVRLLNRERLEVRLLNRKLLVARKALDYCGPWLRFPSAPS